MTGAFSAAIQLSLGEARRCEETEKTELKKVAMRLIKRKQDKE
jgi:hypothetical protein